MTATTRPAPSACPACSAAPAAEALAARDLPDAQIALSLPTIHCAACISKIESALDAHPRVRSARVNLTLKRASIDAAPRDLFHWISAAIALPAIAFSGVPFFRNAWAALRQGRLNMDVPITLAILLAVITSLWETALSGEHAYFDAAIALTFFLLAGRYLDHRTRAIARSAAEELTALEVPRATRLTGSAEEVVSVSELAVGDLILVRPGEIGRAH